MAAKPRRPVSALMSEVGLGGWIAAAAARGCGVVRLGDASIIALLPGFRNVSLPAVQADARRHGRRVCRRTPRSVITLSERRAVCCGVSVEAGRSASRRQ